MGTVTKRSGAIAKRERGRKEMRASILTAAQQIIDTDGLDALTIRAVATRLGYSPGALYEYFSSKEQILGTLYFAGQQGLGDACQHAVASLPGNASPADRITALGQAYRAHALANHQTFRLIFSLFSSPPEEQDLAAKYEQGVNAFAMLIDAVEEGIGDGTIVPAPAPFLATSLWVAVHGFVSLELGGHFEHHTPTGQGVVAGAEAGLHDAMFQNLLDLVLRGLLFQPPA